MQQELGQLTKQTAEAKAKLKALEALQYAHVLMHSFTKRRAKVLVVGAENSILCIPEPCTLWNLWHTHAVGKPRMCSLNHVFKSRLLSTGSIQCAFTSTLK